MRPSLEQVDLFDMLTAQSGNKAPSLDNNVAKSKTIDRRVAQDSFDLSSLTIEPPVRLPKKENVSEETQKDGNKLAQSNLFHCLSVLAKNWTINLPRGIVFAAIHMVTNPLSLSLKSDTLMAKVLPDRHSRYEAALWRCRLGLVIHSALLFKFPGPLAVVLNSVALFSIVISTKLKAKGILRLLGFKDTTGRS